MTRTLTPAILSMLLSATSLAAPLDNAVNTRIEGQQESIASQQKIDQLADETQSMVQEYRQILEQTESLSAYNGQLQKLVHKQEEELASFNRQLANIRNIQQKIVPFMLRMIEVLDEFVALDLPFLPEERQARIENLKQMMDQPDLTLPQKYRRITEAYQVEMDYGRTIEAYTGTLEDESGNRTVDFLRLGRTGLYYLTFGGNQAGYWDQAQRKWVDADENHLRGIRHGLQVARKEAPPDLIEVPVAAPEVVQ